MKQIVILLLSLILLMPIYAQDIITCEDGTVFDNAVTFVLNNLPPGEAYTATALGIGGFDPVIAVVDADGQTRCNLDSSSASEYTANLPSTGEILPEDFNPQIEFSHSRPEPITLLVGGSSSGEFLLIIEGLAVGEEFPPINISVPVTPSVMSEPIPITAYMISTAGRLDPEIIMDDIVCNDPETASCPETSATLVGQSVSWDGGRSLRGGQFDSMLTIETDNYLKRDELRFEMVSDNAETVGEYVAAIHARAGAGGIVEVATPQDEVSTSQGLAVTCEDGTSFENGVEFIVNQMQPDFTYTATAIGIDGFNPVLALVNDDGSFTCVDDSEQAANYTADLPSTGRVPSATVNAQLEFEQDRGQPTDISLIVGSFDNVSGQFLIIFEGMALTELETIGDTFSVQVTPGLSETTLTAYMMSVTNGLDARMYLADSNFAEVTDDAGEAVVCDDSAGLECWGESAPLTTSEISRTLNRILLADTFDSMLTIPVGDFGMDYLTFVMSSFDRLTNGDYVVAFHAEAR